MLLASRAEDRILFLYGFAKNERANIAADELAKVWVVAEYWLAADADMIASALEDGLLIEVDDAG